MKQTPLKRKSAMKRNGRGFSASPAQRKKAQEERCVVTGWTSDLATIDPAHLCARTRGGCDDPLCVVPLTRLHHDLFDSGEFDLLPYLVKHRVPELQHALGHYDGDLIGLLNRLTGESFAPESLYRRES